MRWRGIKRDGEARRASTQRRGRVEEIDSVVQGIGHRRPIVAPRGDPKKGRGRYLPASQRLSEFGRAHCWDERSPFEISVST
jgi:hypothetical protein